MAAKFSGALVLTDLNDFITPSQACVKPVESAKQPGAAATTIQLETDGSVSEVAEDGSAKKLKTTHITLTDCLACSGCITSAETVLVEMQSHLEVNRALRQTEPQPLTVVVSLAPQSRAALAAKYKLPVDVVARRLTAFFRRLGCRDMFDVSFARDLALLETGREFVRRFRSSSSSSAGSSGSVPMLTSACPGWICYAEKTHGSYILPYISTTKSPQQIMGVLVKKHYAQQLNLPPDRIFHVAVMPCYDKKLEASRSDFYDDVYRTRDVDCVITTGEVEKMLGEEGVDLGDAASAPEAPLSTVFTKADASTGELLGSEGSGAGGYLEYVFRYAARELFARDIAKFEYKTVRGTDHQELTLEVDGQVLLRFATAYGFRNIQNFVRKVKTGKSPYHFVEIMACPSACLNGGGQLPGTDLAHVTERYHSLRSQAPEHNAAIAHLYSHWLGGVDSPLSSTLLHTQYHFIEKTLANPLTVQW